LAALEEEGLRDLFEGSEGIISEDDATAVIEEILSPELEEGSNAGIIEEGTAVQKNSAAATLRSA